MSDNTGDRNNIDTTDLIEREELWDLLRRVCPQHKTESPKAYRAFGDTAFSGLSIRRLLARYKEISHLISESYEASVEPPPTLKLNTLLEWSRAHHWRLRLAEWKPVQDAYKRKRWAEREQAILERWNERRARFLDSVDKMLEKADLMIKHPHVERVVDKQVIAEFSGQVIPTKTIIVPAKWGMRDIAAFYKVGCELMIDVVGDRQVMIDRLNADGYIITDPSTGNGDVQIEDYLEAIEKMEGLEYGEIEK